MSKSVNLASLPRDEALLRARAAGRAIFADESAVAAIYQDLMCRWINEHVPHATGQTDEEFGELLSDVEKQFEAGIDEAVEQARSESQPAATLDRVSKMLVDGAAAAFRIFNVLAFMAEAIPDDERGGLPVRCTLCTLRDDVEKLAESLLDLVLNAEKETGGRSHA